MELKDLNKVFPIMEGLMEISAKTKRKPAYIKVAIPDELANHIMMLSLGQEVSIEGLVIAYRDKETL